MRNAKLAVIAMTVIAMQLTVIVKVCVYQILTFLYKTLEFDYSNVPVMISFDSLRSTNNFEL